MDIITKYSVGEKVLWTAEGIWNYSPVVSIKIDIQPNLDISTSYQVAKGNDHYWVEENRMFDSSEEVKIKLDQLIANN